MGGTQSAPRRRSADASHTMPSPPYGSRDSLSPPRGRPDRERTHTSTIADVDAHVSASTSRRRPRPPSFGTATSSAGSSSSTREDGSNSAGAGAGAGAPISRSRTRAYGRKVLTALRGAGSGSGSGANGADAQKATSQRVPEGRSTAGETKRRRTGSRDPTPTSVPLADEKRVEEAVGHPARDAAEGFDGARDGSTQAEGSTDVVMSDADAEPEPAGKEEADAAKQPQEIALDVSIDERDHADMQPPAQDMCRSPASTDTRLPIPTSITVPPSTAPLPGGVGGGALSPSIVPLTTTHDPLLDDRLRMLSAIRDVLGEDVVRSLPAVREGSLRRLSAEGVGLEAMGLGGLAGSPEPETEPQAGEAREPRAGAAAAAEPTATATTTTYPDTAMSTEADQVEATVTSEIISAPDTEASTSIIPLPAAAAAALPALGAPIASGSAFQPPPLPRSRSQLRNVAGRLSGWFGRSDSSERVAPASTQPAATTRPASVASVPLVPPAPASEATADSASTAAASAAAPRAGQLQHVQQGPMMVVQGFVQTSLPMSSVAPATGTAAAEGTSPSTSGPGEATHSTRLLASSSSSPRATTSQLAQPIDAVPIASTAQPAPHSAESISSAQGSAMSSTASASSGSSTLVDSSASASTPNDGSQRRPTFFSRRRGDPVPPTFEEQARMLGGLLGVATAATASSLLAANSAMDAETLSSRLSDQPRRPFDSLRSRLRARAGLSTRDRLERGVEDVLRDYMQNALAAPVSGGNAATTGFALPAEGSAPGTGSAASGDPAGPSADEASNDESAQAAATFDRFLDSMQADLMSAMTEYAQTLEQGDAAGANRHAQVTSSMPATGASSSDNAVGARSTDAAIAQSDATPVAPEAAPQLGPQNVLGLNQAAADEIPSQAPPVDAAQSSQADAPQAAMAQIAPPERRPDVRDGRLNFFRVFQFETRTVPAANTSDANGPPLIPAVIVGVRSVAPGANTLAETEQGDSGVAGIADGAVEGAGPASSAGSPSSQTSSLPAAPAPTNAAISAPGSDAPRRPNWASRLTRSFDRIRGGRQRQPRPDHVSNYVLWVVGGHWPAGHPVIRLPNLVTGQLDYDDIWILAEALGQIKPPTATKEDIAKSGLAIIKAASIPRALQAGEVLSNTAERCLICLSEYEPEEDCRVMGCKHCFHVGCVDRWLETGRNSCPACRQAGVQTQSADAPTDPAGIPLTTAPTTTPQ